MTGHCLCRLVSSAHAVALLSRSQLKQRTPLLAAFMRFRSSNCIPRYGKCCVVLCWALLCAGRRNSP
jgi:hypothetical protein